MAYIPLYRTAHIPANIINAFLADANAATERHEYDEPMGYIMTSTTVPESLQAGTVGPVDDNDLQSNPFVKWTTDQIISWAQRNLLRTDLSPRHMVILDQRTVEDATCLLVSHKDQANEDGEWQIVRSDFETSIVSLMTKEMAVGGDEVLDTNYPGYDGVLRMEVKDRAG